MEKTISIDPSLFEVKKHKKKASPTNRLSSSLNSEFKKNLISKLKEKVKMMSAGATSVSEFESSFEYLKNKKQLNEMQAKKSTINAPPSSTLRQDQEPARVEVPYGCMKNGTKPTYRQFTMKNKEKTEECTAEVEDMTLVRQKITQNKIHLGKMKKDGIVGVLIKDLKTRKKVLKACDELKSTPIQSVKRYLRDHAMIKQGCAAPHDVLRQTFSSSLLAGEIHNKNKETLLHNFISES